MVNVLSINGVLVQVSDKLDEKYPEDRAIINRIKEDLKHGAKEGRYAGVYWGLL